MDILHELSVLQARWKAESPILFQRITNFGVTLGSAGAACLAPSLLPAQAAAHVPSIIPNIGGYAMAIGYAIGLVSKFVVKDPSTLPQKS